MALKPKTFIVEIKDPKIHDRMPRVSQKIF